MSLRPRVLLVAPTLALAKNLFAWLTDGGYDVALVTSFDAAKVQLRSAPHLLISEIRLGEYNGLHLASRARAEGIPSVVVGGNDVVLERDAQQMGITYMNPDIDREYLLVLAEHLTFEARQVPTPLPGRGTGGKLAFISSAEMAPASVRPRPGRRFN